MAIGKALAIMLSVSTAFSGVLIKSNNFKSENINDIKKNFYSVEQSLKSNEFKLVEKYNKLYENANLNIENVEKVNKELLNEIDRIKLEYRELLDKSHSSNNEVNKLKEQVKEKDEYIRQLEGKLNNITNSSSNSNNENNIEEDNANKEEQTEIEDNQDIIVDKMEDEYKEENTLESTDIENQ